MTALQKVAMGLVIVIVDPDIGGLDAVPDVLGWALVLFGLFDLRARLDGFGALVTSAGIAGAVSVVSLRPAFTASLDESIGWFLSLPQLVFSILLCGSLISLIGEVGGHAAGDPAAVDRRAERWFRFLRWVFAVLVVAPALIYGGGLDVLLVPVAVTTVGANVILVYQLFRIATRPYATTSTAG